jgi:hypothetical protein
MSIINNYKRALQDLYDHVGFVEDWVVLAPDFQHIDMFWKIKNNKEVVCGDEIEDITINEEDGHCYSFQIYTQRFYKKHIYRGDKYTMIMVDTHTDGNKFFMFFSNDKEVKD